MMTTTTCWEVAWGNTCQGKTRSKRDVGGHNRALTVPSPRCKHAEQRHHDHHLLSSTP